MYDIKVELLRIAAMFTEDPKNAIKVAKSFYGWVREEELDMRTFTDEEKVYVPETGVEEDVHKSFMDGETDQSIADKLGISKHAVRKVRSKLGLTRSSSSRVSARARAVNQAFYTKSKTKLPAIDEEVADSLIKDHLANKNPRELANVDHCVTWLRGQGHVILRKIESATDPIIFKIEDLNKTKNTTQLISWCNEKRHRVGLPPFLMGDPLPEEKVV